MMIFELNLSQGVVFLLGSLGLILVSRKALLQIHSHGFYRFFAWEILLGMLILNAQTWFRNPFAWYQILSWALLIVSLVLVILGLRLLHQMGKLDKGREDTSLYGLEKTSKLVTVGLYRYIRHPLYSSLLFLAWGVFFKSPAWLDAILALLCTAFLLATSRAEERENIAYFGDEYVNYMKRTRRFIPFVF